MQFYQFLENTKPLLTTISNYLSEKLLKMWNKAIPIIERIIQTGIALYTSFSAYRSTVELLPVLFSGGLTILATAPLLSYLLPSFLFNTTVMFLLLGTISGLVGYYKFHELKLRKELDTKTQSHGRKISRLNEQLKSITKELTELRTQLIRTENSSTVRVNGYSLRATPAREERAGNDSLSKPANRPQKRVQCS